MKKVMLLILSIILINLVFVSAEACNLGISIINQDPYPAIPGDYVEIVFQVNGIANPECGQVTFELLEKYPISFDPNAIREVTINSGTYIRDFSSFLIAPYKVRIDENALNGNNPIEVGYKYKYELSQGSGTKQFDLNIEDSRADFEIFVKEYTGSQITFEILNIAKSDIEALTLEIPKQENIEIKGSKTNIVGDLDSNEYTTADFLATAKKGDIVVNILYTDATNKRRTIEKTVSFEPEYFDGLGEKSRSIWSYLFYIAILVVIIWYVRKKLKERRLKKEQHRHKLHHVR